VSLWGKNITHIYRVWSEDLNHDNAPDVIAGESMWREASSDFPSALQILINKGDGTFADCTTLLNPDVPLQVAEFDYTPSFVDLDHSGINTLLFAGSVDQLQSRQANFLLLNDGTGRLYVGLHDQFLKISPLVYESLRKEFEGNPAYRIDPFDSRTSIPKFIGVPQSDGSLNYVAEVQLSQQLGNGLSQVQYAYVNVPLHYDPTKDFSQDIKSQIAIIVCSCGHGLAMTFLRYRGESWCCTH